MVKQAEKKRWWWFGSLTAQPVIETELTTAVPIDIAIAKLRGFVSDHQAKVISTHENSVELEISSEKVSFDRRKSDRNVDFRIEMEFSERREERKNNSGLASGEYASTHIEVKIRPRRATNRRRGEIAERARLILQSVKAYLMAKESAEREAEAAEATKTS
jgi:hypothetical protein